jgi:hypothetical protein
MKRLIIILAILGLLALASAVVGVASFSTGTQGTSITYHSPLMRLTEAGTGVYMLFLALGIHRRFAPVWGLTFLAMALSWIFTVISVSAEVNANYIHLSDRDSLAFTGLLFVVTSPIVFYWAYRWYKQKQYFYGDSA